MRITQQLVANLTRQRNQRASSTLYGVTARITATSAVERPSQDPVRATRINNLERFTHELDIIDTNRRTIKTDLTAAESLVASMQDIALSAKDVALAMSSDAVNNEDRQNAAKEVTRLRDQLIGLANRRQAGGKYLFAGLSESSPPLDQTSGAYMGDSQARLVEIGPGVSIEATVTGADVFGPGGQQVLEAFGQLIRALETDPSTLPPGEDVAGQVRLTLNALDDAHDNLTLGRTEIGGRLATIEDVDSLSLDLRNAADLEHADLTAVDLAKLAPELSSAQNMLSATVETTRTLMQQVGASWLR